MVTCAQLILSHVVNELRQDIRATVAGYFFDDRLLYCRTLGYLYS